jgi:hypothetical protein
MRLAFDSRRTACNSALALCLFPVLCLPACRAPRPPAGEPEPDAKRGRIEFDCVPDPNDGREAIFEVLIFP